MKIYNQDKTNILTEYDLDKGYLKDDYIDIILPEIQEVKEHGHYETITTYPNGGKDVKWVVDIKGQKYQPAKTFKEKILIYIPYTQEELSNIKLNKLRIQRENECFFVINRGELWYKRLAEEQKQELNIWYQQWLDVTEETNKDENGNYIIPIKPSWLI